MRDYSDVKADEDADYWAKLTEKADAENQARRDLAGALKASAAENAKLRHALYTIKATIEEALRP